MHCSTRYHGSQFRRWYTALHSDESSACHSGQAEYGSCHRPLECFTSVKLNSDKSEVIWLGTRQQLAKLSSADKKLQPHDSTLTASTTVRNLGVQLDSELNFVDQARCCVKACYYHLRRILQIRRHVDNDYLRSLKHTVLVNAPPRSPSLPLLHQLHWLPIESRICYKLMNRVNHHTAPSYLSELCVPCSDTRLWSTTRGIYMIARTHNTS